MTTLICPDIHEKAVKLQLKPGDRVLPLRGRGGPWVIKSLGSQPHLFGPDVEVAILEDGSFMEIEKLKKVRA